MFYWSQCTTVLADYPSVSFSHFLWELTKTNMKSWKWMPVELGNVQLAQFAHFVERVLLLWGDWFNMCTFYGLNIFYLLQVFCQVFLFGCLQCDGQCGGHCSPPLTLLWLFVCPSPPAPPPLFTWFLPDFHLMSPDLLFPISYSILTIFCYSLLWLFVSPSPPALPPLFTWFSPDVTWFVVSYFLGVPSK